MKVRHTSDWCIGRTLDSRKRYEESGAILTWLAGYHRREGEEESKSVSRSLFGVEKAQGLLYDTIPQVQLNNLVVTNEVKDKLTRVIGKRRQIYTCFQRMHKGKGL